MKKAFFVIFILILSSITVFLGLSTKKNSQPYTYYQVTLDGELIGNIKSKKQLERYISNTEEYIKQKYNIDEVYAPNGLEVKKIVSYAEKLDDISDIYNLIQSKKPFTVKGYQLTVYNNEESQVIYVLDDKIYKESLENAIKTFVGTDNYNNYINKNQSQIKDVGTYINNIYIENEMTIKEAYIPTTEKIYTSAEELTKYLLFGTTEQQKKYVVNLGDTMEQVAFDNEISVEELLISNPQFKNSNALLYPGLELVIGILDPQIKVTVEQQVIEDLVDSYKTIEEVDETLNYGVTKVTQQGEDGLLRIKQDVKITNGTTVYVKQLSKESLKPAIDKIVVKGGKRTYGIGSSTWLWPTDSGWTISSGYSYRINPVTGARELHGALDIAGTGYGSNVYASNSGVIVTKSYTSTAGNYIVINHNNGYYTQYNHMSRFESLSVGDYVEKGQVIGYVGMTGQATGPHLHFAVWYGGPAYRGVRVNPWTLFR